MLLFVFILVKESERNSLTIQFYEALHLKHHKCSSFKKRSALLIKCFKLVPKLSLQDLFNALSQLFIGQSFVSVVVKVRS